MVSPATLWSSGSATAYSGELVRVGGVRAGPLARLAGAQSGRGSGLAGGGSPALPEPAGAARARQTRAATMWM
jgi:hypothetical protein